MSELSYPSFPRRAFLAAGAALLAFVAAVVLVNASADAGAGTGPGLRACAVAAERVMVAENYSVAIMELTGPDSVRACHGLTERQFARALSRTYEIEYGGRLPKQPVSFNMPPPTFKALSSRSLLRAQGQPGSGQPRSGGGRP